MSSCQSQQKYKIDKIETDLVLTLGGILNALTGYSVCFFHTKMGGHLSTHLYMEVDMHFGEGVAISNYFRKFIMEDPVFEKLVTLFPKQSRLKWISI